MHNNYNNRLPTSKLGNRGEILVETKVANLAKAFLWWRRGLVGGGLFRRFINPMRSENI